MSLADPVLSYVLAARPVHERLREALIQLSAFALLEATQPTRAKLDTSVLDRAREALKQPAAETAALRVPSGAMHHHHHLRGAVAALERALSAGYSRGIDHDDALFAAVNEAERQLRAATRALPGFEIVDLTQACCAMHAGITSNAQPAR